MQEPKYWQVSVQFVTEDAESGKIRKINETYLVDAMSATEAEAKTIKHFEGTIGEYSVTKASQSRILDVID